MKLKDLKSKSLTKEQLVELKELYIESAGWKSVREMANYFGVSIIVIRWAVNYKNFRENHSKLGNKWRKKNPKRIKIIQARAIKKYQSSEKGKKKLLEYRRKNRELLNEKMKDRYWKNRDKMLKYLKDRYHSNLEKNRKIKRDYYHNKIKVDKKILINK